MITRLQRAAQMAVSEVCRPPLAQLLRSSPPDTDRSVQRALASLLRASPPATPMAALAKPAIRPPASPAWDKTFAPRAGRVTSAFAPTAEARLTQAKTILKANGAWPPKAGEVYVLQIDQDNPPASAGKDAVGKFLLTYTGQLCVFAAQANHDGEVTLVDLHPSAPLRSSSHPGQRTTTAAPDCNGDGYPDVAWLRTGVYPFRSLGYTYVTNTTDDATVARDLDHDGTIDAVESKATEGQTGKDILFHAGHSLSPTSIGCQTLPPDAYRRFAAAVGRHDFTYVLVRRPNDVSGERAW